jgi:hypothetical protein
LYALQRFFASPWTISRLRKNPMLPLILGSAADDRCDNWLLFSLGFSLEVRFLPGIGLFRGLFTRRE